MAAGHGNGRAPRDAALRARVLSLLVPEPALALSRLPARAPRRHLRLGSGGWALPRHHPCPRVLVSPLPARHAREESRSREGHRPPGLRPRDPRRVRRLDHGPHPGEEPGLHDLLQRRPREPGRPPEPRRLLASGARVAAFGRLGLSPLPHDHALRAQPRSRLPGDDRQVPHLVGRLPVVQERGRPAVRGLRHAGPRGASARSAISSPRRGVSTPRPTPSSARSTPRSRRRSPGAAGRAP